MPLTPGSLAACLSTASASARSILSSAAASRADPAESPFNRPSISSGKLRCKFVVFPGQFSDTGTRTTIAETPLIDDCPPKVRPRYLVFHQHLSWVSGHHQRSLHSNLDVERIVTAIWDWGVARISSILPASHLSDSGTLLMFADLVLIASPCSDTTTASNEEFSMATNTLGWNRGSHFPPLAGLAGMHRIFSPNSRIGVLSLRPCSLAAVSFRRCRCRTCSSGLPQTPPASTISLRRAGLWPQCDAPVQPSVSWPDQQRAPPHAR